MRGKKAAALFMAAVITFGMFLAPVSELQTKAVTDWSAQTDGNTAPVYVVKSAESIPYVVMQTPPGTVKMFAGMTWVQMGENRGVRLIVSDSHCGVLAQASLQSQAAALGVKIVKILDMDLEIYLEKYHEKDETLDVLSTLSPIRVTIALPENFDQSKDYAVISLTKNGATEILGDLDNIPSTITVDTSYFDTYAIACGEKGAFDAYKIASTSALQEVWMPYYVEHVNSTIQAESDRWNDFSIGLQTDAGTVKQVVGDPNPSIKISQYEPGVIAKNSLQYAAYQLGANCDYYHEVYLNKGTGERVTTTGQKLRVALSVPEYYPIYADYAVAVVNGDGSVSIIPDLNQEDGMVVFDTDQFRAYAMLWGAKGTFASFVQP